MVPPSHGSGAACGSNSYVEVKSTRAEILASSVLQLARQIPSRSADVQRSGPIWHALGRQELHRPALHGVLVLAALMAGRAAEHAEEADAHEVPLRHCRVAVGVAAPEGLNDLSGDYLRRSVFLETGHSQGRLPRSSSAVKSWLYLPQQPLKLMRYLGFSLRNSSTGICSVLARSMSTFMSAAACSRAQAVASLSLVKERTN